MKYLRSIFESNSLFTMVTHHYNDEITTINFSNYEKAKIKNYADKNNIEIEIRDNYKYIGLDIDYGLLLNITLDIYKIEDDYFFVCVEDKLIKNRWHIVYYKCDTIDGLFELFNDELLIKTKYETYKKNK